jgi:hypothetical protein
MYQRKKSFEKFHTIINPPKIFLAHKYFPAQTSFRTNKILPPKFFPAKNFYPAKFFPAKISNPAIKIFPPKPFSSTGFRRRGVGPQMAEKIRNVRLRCRERSRVPIHDFFYLIQLHTIKMRIM